jgi:hypothetical protein
MRRAARPAAVVMGAKLVRVRGTDTDLQHGTRFERAQQR